MNQRQPFGVQGLTAELLNSRDARWRCAWRESGPSAIHGIAQQWQTDMGHVDANLMGASGFQFHPQQRMSAEPAQHPVMGDRRFAARGHGHALPIHRMPTHGRIHRTARHRHSIDDRQIFPLNGSRL